MRRASRPARSSGSRPAQPVRHQVHARPCRRERTPLTPTVDWGPALGTGVVNGGMSYAPAPQPIFYRDRKVTRVAIGTIEAASPGAGDVRVRRRRRSLLPERARARARSRRRCGTIRSSCRPRATAARRCSSSPGACSSPEAANGAEYFFGPKDLDVLQAVKPDLVRAIDFGMFDWLVVPLLRALKWVNGYIGNYGWSIIALTVLINLAMFPLRHKSVVSMRKMQELQPQMKAIQDRYAKLKMSDPGAAEDEQGGDGALQAARRQPGGRLRADAADAAGAVRVLLHAVGRDRAARRAVHRLDQRPVGARSAVRQAGADGRHAVHPAEDDADVGATRCSRR